MGLKLDLDEKEEGEWNQNSLIPGDKAWGW